MSTNVYLRQFRCVFLGFILWAACANAHAAVQMKATLGFDGVVKSSVWSPASVEMHNTTDDEIEGTLRIVQVGQPFERHATCAARVVLPAHARKRYYTYTRLGQYQGGQVVVFQRGGSVIAETQASANPCSRDDRLVVSVGGRSARLNFMNGVVVPPKSRRNYPGGYGQSSQSTIYVGSIAPKMLPDRPLAFEGVDVMVLFELLPASTNPKALNSIAMWVASGGTLVIPTGPNFRSFQDDFYNDLLPVRLVGTVDLPGLPSLSGLGKREFPAGAVTVAKGVLKPGMGTVVVAESGVPLVAERSYGAGRVVYLAFDPLGPPFRSWDGQTEFWKAIVQMSTSEPLAVSTLSGLDESMLQGNYYQYQGYDWINQSGGMFPMVAQHPSVRAPSFNTIGLFLMAYLILLAPVNYFVLKRRKRLELAWITTPAVVLLFTVGAYAVGYTMKGSDLRLREVTMIEGSQDARFARVVTDASLFSPARRSYDITADDTYSIAQAMPARENDAPPEGIVDEKCSLADVKMAMWSSKMFESVSGVDLGGTVRARLRLNGMRLQGEIVNETRIPLTGCVLCYAGERANIGDLPRGGSAKIDLTLSPNTPAPALRGSGQLDLALRNYAARVAVSAREPVLLARPASPRPVFGVAGVGAGVESAACYLFRLTYEGPSEFRVMSGDMVTTLSNPVGCNAEAEGPGVGGRAHPVRLRIWGGGKGIVTFRLITPPKGALNSLRLYTNTAPPGASPSGPSSNVEIAAYNHRRGVWDALIVPADGRPLDPSQFMNSANEVRIRVRRGGGGSSSVDISLTARGMSK